MLGRIVASLVAATVLTACEAPPSEAPPRDAAPTPPLTSTAPGASETFRRLVDAVRRDDQTALDALLDKPAVARFRRGQYDQLTGHGAWLKPPDRQCARWRPVSPRRPVDAQAPLTTTELGPYLDAGPGAPAFHSQPDGRVRITLPFGVTAAGLELTRQDETWRVTGFSVPTEIPRPPQFVCVIRRAP